MRLLLMFRVDSISYCERSALFVKELSFPQTVPTDDAFFNRNWARACWNRWAGPLDLGVGLLCKNKKQKRSAGAHPLPLRCLSQFLPTGENINCLGNEVLVHKSAFLSPMRWPGIYSICFSQLDGDKDSLLLDGGFSFHIAVRLIKDNWKAVLGIILLPLLVRFGLIYRISSYWELSYFRYW